MSSPCVLRVTSSSSSQKVPQAGLSAGDLGVLQPRTIYVGKEVVASLHRAVEPGRVQLGKSPASKNTAANHRDNRRDEAQRLTTMGYACRETSCSGRNNSSPGLDFLARHQVERRHGRRFVACSRRVAHPH